MSLPCPNCRSLEHFSFGSVCLQPRPGCPASEVTDFTVPRGIEFQAFNLETRFLPHPYRLQAVERQTDSRALIWLVLLSTAFHWGFKWIEIFQENKHYARCRKSAL